MAAISAVPALVGVIGGKRLHREGPGPVGVDRRRRADAVVAHQRIEPREQRRNLLGRRIRPREERMLQHAPRCGIDDNPHAIDRGGRRMRFEIEQRERTERADITHGRRQLQAARPGLASDQAERDVQHCRATVAPLETRRQRLEQSRQHERQRLEPVDRPFELD